MNSRSTMQLVGVALLVLGAGLAIWGYQMSGSMSSQFHETFSGSPTDKVMTLYIGGGVSAAVGLFLFLKR